jgi:hypothetical protein
VGTKPQTIGSVVPHAPDWANTPPQKQNWVCCSGWMPNDLFVSHSLKIRILLSSSINSALISQGNPGFEKTISKDLMNSKNTCTPRTLPSTPDVYSKFSGLCPGSYLCLFVVVSRRSKGISGISRRGGADLWQCERGKGAIFTFIGLPYCITLRHIILRSSQLALPYLNNT